MYLFNLFLWFLDIVASAAKAQIPCACKTSFKIRRISIIPCVAFLWIVFCQAFFKDVTLLPNHRFQMFCIVVFQITRIARDANPSPSCLQTTAASRIVQCSLHIPLQES